MDEPGKLAGIVTSPARTFDAILQRPTWLVPLATVLFVNLLIRFVVYNVIATGQRFDGIARAKIQWDARTAGTNPTEAEIEQQVTALRRHRNYCYATPFIGLPLSLPMTVVFISCCGWFVRALHFGWCFRCRVGPLSFSAEAAA
jgi:hypothetical protein